MEIIKAIENLDNIIKKVETSRLKIDNHLIVQIVAVSKYSTSENIKSLYNAGQRAFGENKIQDFKQKKNQLSDLPISWHFIGTLQKNKINNLIDLNPVLFHSLDNMELVKELDKKLKAKNKTMNCLLQINSAYEDTKSGFNPKDVLDIYEEIKIKYTNIKLKGVMSIGANTKDNDLVTESFKITKNIFDNIDGNICSMGMSNDFESAILSGSNMIRVGSLLFK